MSQSFSAKVKDKINEDLSPTKNLTGLHLKIVASIAIIWSLFQLWYASPFPFMFNIGMFKGLPARAIHLGFALTLAFLIYPISKKKDISIFKHYLNFNVAKPIIVKIIEIIQNLITTVDSDQPFFSK